MKFDWSQFHPLMHRIGSRDCFGWYGGPWRHAQLLWEFRLRGEVHELLFCRRGRHEYVDVYSSKGDRIFEPDWVECAHCGKRL